MDSHGPRLTRWWRGFVFARNQYSFLNPKGHHTRSPCLCIHYVTLGMVALGENGTRNPHINAFTWLRLRLYSGTRFVDHRCIGRVDFAVSASAPDPHPLERTRLSWQRTSIAIGATGLVLSKLFFNQAPILSAIAIAITIAMALLTWRVARQRLAAIHITPPGERELPFSGRTGIILSLAVSALALATIVAVIGGTIQW